MRTSRRAYPRCAAGSTVREACSGLVDDLHERWDLPSVYLLVDGRLRCQASRGYFQVSDGFTPDTGVLGRVVRSGVPEVVPDVTLDPTFIAAIPGLRAEVCVPVVVFGAVVGAVNLESRSELEDGALEAAEHAAAVLGRRLEELGGLPAPSLAERLGRVAVTLAGQTDAAAVERLVVASAIELSGMSTAALARRREGQWGVVEVQGPLAPQVRTWDHEALSVLGRWVGSGASSYFPDGEAVQTGFEFVGLGLHALCVQPLVVAGQVVGLLLVADTAPGAHDPALTATLELLAAQTAAVLTTVTTLDALAHQATRDPLTGLVNRRRLLQCLDADVEDQLDSALVLLDLDGFKSVNDLHGHAAGDAVLVSVAERLQAAARPSDVVCRLGGDEFAVLLRRVESSAAAQSAAQRLVRAVCDPPGGRRHPEVGASAGLRLVHGGTTGSLLVDADAALYAAKRSGRGRVVVWEPSLRQDTIEQGALVDDLLGALGDDDLRVVYQPIVDTSSLRVVGVEALARWTHPRRGVVPPALFVAAAERSGVVDHLTRWVLRTVCHQVAQWHADLNVGVNISGAQLTAGHLVDDVRAVLLSSGLEPRRLVLEVTETSAVGDLPRAAQTLEELSDLGVTLALDDFGTGHSSLTHAHTLPYDVLKIDRSFVAAAAAGDKRAVATVAAVAVLAQRLGVDVVAEGVEDQAELAALTALGCRYAQGYALSRPLEARAVTAMVQAPGTWDLRTQVPAPRRPEVLAARH